MPINERRGNRVSAQRTNSERTYDHVKHNSRGGKEKKLMHQKWFLSFAQEQSRHFPSFLPEATSLNKATELIYCL